jgi:predicted nucleic acid-binding protein
LISTSAPRVDDPRRHVRGFALARRGASVKTVDLLIAAHAIAHGVAVLTGDRDFERIRRAGVGLLLVEIR